MEPKLNNLPKPVDLRHEPRIGNKSSNPGIPHIVPADMRKPVSTAKSIPSSVETKKKSSTASEKDPLKLMAELSAQVNEMSVPKEESKESYEVKGASGIEYPKLDDLGDPEDPPSASGGFRSLLLFLSLIVIILATWQVTLFLQPQILKKEPFNSLSEKSCQYFYCPELRTPVVLSNQLDSLGNNHWLLKLKLQNQDIRSQNLPRLQVTIESTGRNTATLSFAPSYYSVTPKVEKISGGETVQIEVPFEFSEGLPSGFNVTVLPDSGQKNR